MRENFEFKYIIGESVVGLFNEDEVGRSVTKCDCLL
jgi:hypothetical protein